MNEFNTVLDGEFDQQKAEEYEAIVSSLPDLVFVLTESGRYAAVLGGNFNEQYHEATALENTNLLDVFPLHEANWFLEKIQQTLKANKLQIFEYSLEASKMDVVDPQSGPEGEIRFEGRVSPLKSLRYGERAVVWVARNITTRYQLEQQLTFQAEVDSLSGVGNRRKLFQGLGEAFYSFQRYGHEANLLLIDIDNFKRINDSFGHQMGDDIIRKLANICQSEARKTDIVARIGGDEFAIIYFGNQHDSCELAQRLNKRIEVLPFAYKLSISIGVSKLKPGDEDVSEVYQRADKALYHAKSLGKNTFAKYSNTQTSQA